MTSSGANKKKKRKAAKKKKKKQLSNKSKGEDDQRSEEIGDGANEMEEEECGSSSVGLALELESVDGSENGGEKKVETDLRQEDNQDKEEEWSSGVVGDYGTVRESWDDSSLDNEDDKFVQEKEFTEESVKPKEGDDAAVYELTEKAVLTSEEVNHVVKDIPIDKTEVLNGNELCEDKMVSSQVEHIKMVTSQVEDNLTEKANGLDAIESHEGKNKTVSSSSRDQLSKNKMVPSQAVEGILLEKTNEAEDKNVSSLNTPRVETEGIKEDDYTESSQNQANVPFAQPMMQRTTWKCCCGLFEVFAGSNR